MSVHQSIAEAVKTAIEALTSPPTVVLRIQAWKIDGDTLPLVIVTKGDQRTTEYTLGGTVFREYEIIVTVLYSQAAKVQTGIDDAMAWRETIRKRLVPDPTVTPPILTGVSVVWDCDAVEFPAQDRGQFEAGYEEARLGLLYRTNEETHA